MVAKLLPSPTVSARYMLFNIDNNVFVYLENRIIFYEISKYFTDSISMKTTQYFV